ncbi:MAG: anhydro-N-acetylmuramic acid kinase [Bacteroidetes bacterium]|nr:anhydro-N-acetylmuramic acid kinase [Bacteroidota bacterium]
MLIKDESNKITVIGLMSGTSLDGVDLAACSFENVENRWTYELSKAETIPYSSEWENKLRHLQEAPAPLVFETHAALGRMYGEMINAFAHHLPQKPDLIASHGHTLFHRPDLDYTTQIGCGAHIAAVTGIDTVCDFRSKDVALGGQGAPLVPVGDHYLFSDYDACINLGGIANISMIAENRRIAFDISPVNMALNVLANREGLPYDDRGKLAASGEVIPEKLKAMNDLEFYKIKGAKSIGREWFEKHFLPIIQNGKTADLCRTVCEHIADQHTLALQSLPEQAKILVTGGGAFNTFLVERISEKSKKQLHVPKKELVQFKEAIVFAFLGVLNYWGRVNVFDSATGSVKQHVGGAFYRGE